MSPETTTLGRYLDVEAATDALRRAGIETVQASPIYLRHKPQQTTIVAYELSLEDGSKTYGYAQWCAASARADQIFTKAIALRPRPSDVGPAVGRIDRHTVFYGFPNDARLRRLRWYVDPRKLKRSLARQVRPPDRISGRKTQITVLRYKPERRVVARVDLATSAGEDRPLLVRYSTRRQAAHLAALAVHLRQWGVSTPAPVARLDDDHVGIDEFIEGRELRDVVRAGKAHGAELAEAIRAFHTASPLPHVATRPVPGELGKARRGLAGLCEWEPALGGLAASVAELLERSVPTPGSQALIHGDLHADNVLVTDGRTAFVDLDRVSVGSPAIDLGSFVAHAMALDVRQPGWSPNAVTHACEMVDRYRSLGGDLDEAALGWHIATGLVDQALLATRHLDRDWRSSATRLLERARAQLERPALITGVNR